MFGEEPNVEIDVFLGTFFRFLLSFQRSREENERRKEAEKKALASAEKARIRNEQRKLQKEQTAMKASVGGNKENVKGSTNNLEKAGSGGAMDRLIGHIRTGKAFKKDDPTAQEALERFANVDQDIRASRSGNTPAGSRNSSPYLSSLANSRQLRNSSLLRGSSQGRFTLSGSRPPSASGSRASSRANSRSNSRSASPVLESRSSANLSTINESPAFRRTSPQNSVPSSPTMRLDGSAQYVPQSTMNNSSSNNVQRPSSPLNQQQRPSSPQDHSHKVVYLPTSPGSRPVIFRRSSSQSPAVLKGAFADVLAAESGNNRYMSARTHNNTQHNTTTNHNNKLQQQATTKRTQRQQRANNKPQQHKPQQPNKQTATTTQTKPQQQ